jgi:antitoxin MazE
MIQQIRKIGNSSGIIIPKAFLERCEMADHVEIEIVQDMIVIKPMQRKIRENWDAQFKEANVNFKEIDENEDNEFVDLINEFDVDEW